MEPGGTALSSKTWGTKFLALGYFSSNILLSDSKVK